MEKPIRILHILQRMEAAGVQTFLMNVYRAIDRDKIQFDFLVQYKTDEFYDNEIISMGGRIYKFSVREDYNTIKYRNELKNFFKKHKEYKIIHGHMETLSNIWEKEARNANISSIIVHAHTAGFNEKNSVKLLIKEFFRMNYGKYANRLFACSRAAGKFMYKEKNFDIIPNAIDVSCFKFSNEKRSIRTCLGIEDNFVIGHVGRFHPSKNHLFIIEIAEKLVDTIPNLKVMLVGDGELKSKVQEEISKRKLDKIFLLMGNRKDVNLLYSAMDAFVMPSIFEGLPLVGIEAQAAGLPCLFSEGITTELRVTDLAEFLPISSGVSSWIKKLEIIANMNLERETYAQIVSEKGYDVNTLASKLSRIYETEYKETNCD